MHLAKGFERMSIFSQTAFYGFDATAHKKIFGKSLRGITTSEGR
jgi:hypothetical protein